MVNHVQTYFLFPHSLKFPSTLPISKEEVEETLNNDIYIDHLQPVSLPKIGLHRLSLVLMVFALGCLFDEKRPICSLEAEDFHSLARAALCGEQIFSSTSLDCIQSMVSPKIMLCWHLFD